MTKKPDREPAAGQAGARAERERRLAQALRDNLRRRKDQARAKQDAQPATEGAVPAAQRRPRDG